MDRCPRGPEGSPGGAHPPIEDFCADLQRLRLTLDADLSVAAAALESDQPEIAREIVEADRAELARFTDRRLARLGPLRRGTSRHAARPRRRRATAPALAAAAAAVALLAATGGLGLTERASLRPAPTRAPAAVGMSLASFRSALLLHRTDEAAVMQAAQRLHMSLLPLLDAAAGDPAAAREAVALLYEEQAIVAAVRPVGAAALLSEVDALLASLAPVSSHPGASPRRASSGYSLPTAVPLPAGSARPTLTPHAQSLAGKGKSPAPALSPAVPQKGAAAPRSSPQPAATSPDLPPGTTGHALGGAVELQTY